MHNIYLSNDSISYVMGVSAEGVLEHLYFGKKVHQPEILKSPHKRMYRCIETHYQDVRNYSLQSVPREWPTHGASDYRQPAFHALTKEGHSLFDFRYKQHQTLANKPDLGDLPSSRQGASQTLEVELYDVNAKISVFLYYTLYQAHDVLTRSVKIVNHSDESICIEHIHSSCIDFPAAEYELLSFGGSWGREFSQQRIPIQKGRHVIESSLGNSSAQQHPFVAVMSPETTQSQGVVVATALAYSGNFSISTERNEFDNVRVLAGINPFGFSWQLEPSTSFITPEAVHVYSSEGLQGMSKTLHGFIQAHISPQAHSALARPTYLNTWESCYFDVTEENVFELGKVAQSLDLDMLVLDDGWFKNRTDDKRALGDWYADSKRFPKGIPALAKRIKALNLKFGIWVEPEMVNPDSDLFRRHPDWALHVPGYTASTGRHQLTLDLSRDDVIAYLEERLNDLFSCGNIDYVKWDMNRSMSETGSAGWPAAQQGEVAHRYILNLYGLLHRLTQKYPHILFENCASGGNRHDLGMLSFMNNSWISDMSEPIGRLSIQNGASHIFPMSTYSSYICPSPGHQNGRYASLETRFNVAFFCGSRGLSLSKKEIAENHAALKTYVQQFKESAHDAINGQFHRLLYSANDVCWQLSSEDGKTIYLGYFNILCQPNAPYRRAYLLELDENATYIDTESQQHFSGAELMHAGFGLPYVSTIQGYMGDVGREQAQDLLAEGDFVSKLIILKKVE